MFEPAYEITPAVANALMRIEASRQAVADLPIVPNVLASLRRTARLRSTHYSTMIEGNRLSEDQVKTVLEESTHFTGRERDEAEVLGYYAAMERLEELISQEKHLSEGGMKILHALVMAGGRKRVRGTPYRDGQNVIYEGHGGKIVYMPPEAVDVGPLMRELFQWIQVSAKEVLPTPVRAAIAHYQYATIHPYYDGNGRSARLLTTWVLYGGGYDLKGVYSLEEYYAENLPAYYKAIAVGPSHNYYLGRKEASITKWVEYFCEGMAQSFEKVRHQVEKVSGETDKSALLRQLTSPQRKALELFADSEVITSRDVEAFFGFKPRTAREWCRRWVESGFLEVASTSKKTRTYRLGKVYENLFSSPEFR